MEDFDIGDAGEERSVCEQSRNEKAFDLSWTRLVELIDIFSS
jgi:hypothetical protein